MLGYKLIHDKLRRNFVSKNLKANSSTGKNSLCAVTLTETQIFLASTLEPPCTA